VADEIASVTLRGVRLIFRNFAGAEGPNNTEGDRNVCVMLTESEAEFMLKDGWNVKRLRPDEDGNLGSPFLPVAVRFDIKPPKIVLITSKNRTTLTEEHVNVLDWLDFSKVDVIVRASDWSRNGRSGRKAYLKTAFLTVAEDELEMEYGSMDDMPARAGNVEE